MRVSGMKGLIAIFLFLGFYMLFRRMEALQYLAEALKRTRSGVNDAARQRSLADRQNLLKIQEQHSRWYAIERKLQYCGIRRRFPGITAEWWILGNIGVASVLFAAVSAAGGLGAGILVLLSLAGAEHLFLWSLRRANFRRTEENLTKLLDFLDNYSAASGEITGIFGQISRYMDEPVKGALDVCCYESATTGDVSLALLAMAECIEHPKFKELVRNMEVSVRYCADFSVLVSSSRRSLREYLRVSRERRSMLREGAINLMLLAIMSAVVLLIVGSFTGSGWTI